MIDDKEPEFATQHDDYGNLEKIDISKYDFRVICSTPGCKRIRYVKSQDRFQVEKCKPCAYASRKAKKAISERARRRRMAKKD